MSSSHGTEVFLNRQTLEAPVTLAPVPEGKTTLIRLREVSKHFGARHILRGITFNIYKGETLAIIGGSGSGKTTLLRHLMGCLLYTSDAADE